MLARKNQLQSNRPSGATALEKSRLNQARTLAQRRHDYAEVAEIDIKLAELAASTIDAPLREERVDMLAKVNERNRKANLEAVRKAELIEAERKRKERKLAASGGTLTPQDPSARLKILPRLFNAATPSSRFVSFYCFLFNLLRASLFVSPSDSCFYLCPQARNTKCDWNTSTGFTACDASATFGALGADEWNQDIRGDGHRVHRSRPRRLLEWLPFVTVTMYTLSIAVQLHLSRRIYIVFFFCWVKIR